MLLQVGSTASIGWPIDQIAASVAPPRLTTRACGASARTRSGSSTGLQWPLSRAERRRARRVARGRGVRHDHRAAGREEAEAVVDREIEAERREREHPV